MKTILIGFEEETWVRAINCPLCTGAVMSSFFKAPLFVYQSETYTQFDPELRNLLGEYCCHQCGYFVR